jgi:hypothetical protein
MWRDPSHGENKEANSKAACHVARSSPQVGLAKSAWQKDTGMTSKDLVVVPFFKARVSFLDVKCINLRQ